jgi:hypothetical protein
VPLQHSALSWADQRDIAIAALQLCGQLAELVEPQPLREKLDHANCRLDGKDRSKSYTSLVARCEVGAVACADRGTPAPSESRTSGPGGAEATRQYREPFDLRCRMMISVMVATNPAT